MLGPHRKYSSCYWGDGIENLEAAEAAALAITAERAGVENGMRILELGCGWGSLTLWMASRYPDARILGVSNSASQRRYIEEQAAHRDLRNLRVVTTDMNDFDTGGALRPASSRSRCSNTCANYRELFRRIAGWLFPDGRLFVHIFCHRAAPYAFVPADESDWMSRYFFSGGIMPSDALPLCFPEHLTNVGMWRWSGRHYQRTANAWLANMDARRARIRPILEAAYGASAPVWWERWRVFFMACAELFGYAGGQEWWVSHYLFKRSRR